MQNATELLAELLERVRRLEAMTQPLFQSDGTIKTTAVAGTGVHQHTGGGNGGPLGGSRVTTYLEFDEQSAAPGAPPTGRVRVYAKTDGRMYSKDDTNTESAAL